MNISKLNPMSYRTIGPPAYLSKSNKTKADDSHGLWREDLQQKMDSAQGDERLGSVSILGEIDQAYQLDKATGHDRRQSSNNTVVIGNVVTSEKIADPHALNVILLQVYQDHKRSPAIGTLLSIAA